MKLDRGIIVIALLASVTLAACAKKDPVLTNLRSSGNGPDEFAVLPAKPLEAPEDYAALPTPTPGGGNRVDPTPKSDAIAVLGGNAARQSPGSAALMAHATRFGVAGDIRQTLAADDIEWRRDHRGRILERVFNVDVYMKAYADMRLDAYQELARIRRIGLKNPAAPPAPVE